jgi:hypothetical protein
MMLLRATLSQRSEIAAITINQNGVAYPETFYLLGPDGNPKSGWTLLVDHPKNAKNEHNYDGSGKRNWPA